VINFISHLPKDLRSGGFSAMNAAACAALARRYPLTYVGPIDPPVAPWDKAVSKALRLAGLGGAFPSYSESRLGAIANQVAGLANPNAQLDFFHGLTMWSSTRPRRPYVAWSDCIFADYIEIYHDRAHFGAEDLRRIEAAEQRWLRSASRVLFTSRWAANRAVSRYGLEPARVRSVGIFGEIEPPQCDVYAGGRDFAFVSTDFEAKGGPVVLAALRRLRQSHPDATLTIVGAAPGDIAGEPGVTYAGYLRKEAPEEQRRFHDILGRAVAVAHPTRSDIAPLLLVEAALFGCPAIASRAFAIPELVEAGQTGVLLDNPADPAELAAAMAALLDHPGYAGLRANALRRARAEHGKDRFEALLLAVVDQTLSEAGAAVA
jgi:glycosyltransferase involved in cell wall biosynthesis